MEIKNQRMAKQINNLVLFKRGSDCMNNKEKPNASGALELLYDEDDYGRLKCTVLRKIHIKGQEIFRSMKENKNE